MTSLACDSLAVWQYQRNRFWTEPLKIHALTKYYRLRPIASKVDFNMVVYGPPAFYEHIVFSNSWSCNSNNIGSDFTEVLYQCGDTHKPGLCSILKPYYGTCNVLKIEISFLTTIHCFIACQNVNLFGGFRFWPWWWWHCDIPVSVMIAIWLCGIALVSYHWFM